MPDISSCWNERIRLANLSCSQTLGSPEFTEVFEISAEIGMGPSQLTELVSCTARGGLPLELWEPLAEACEKRGISEGSLILQRFVLLAAGTANLTRVPQLPVAEEVKENLIEQVRYVCVPKPQMPVLFQPRNYGFQVMCKFMLLQRFPAGQSEWEISAFPRSWLATVPLSDVPAVLRCVFLRAGGHRPFLKCTPPYAVTYLSSLKKMKERVWC